MSILNDFDTVIKAHNMGALGEEGTTFDDAASEARSAIHEWDAMFREDPKDERLSYLIEWLESDMSDWDDCYDEEGYETDAPGAMEAQRRVEITLDKIRDRAEKIAKKVDIKPVGGTMFAAYCGENYIGQFEAGSIDDDGRWVEPDDEGIEDIAMRELDLSIETEIAQ